MPKSFQEYYQERYSHCFGCGHSNEKGWKLKSYWDGDETYAKFSPAPEYTGGYPGYVYGGLLAALLDCHGNATAAAAGYRAEGREMDSLPNLRYVTANLQIDFIKPTPMNVELELRGRPVEVKGRKVVMELWVVAQGEITVKASMVAVKVPS